MRNVLILLIILILAGSEISAQNTNRIAYASNQTSTQILQIFTMNLDGSDKKQLTNLPTNCMYPKWSPDGKQIVFNTDDNSIYIIKDANLASDPVFLFNGNNPVFTSEGNEIVFNSEYQGVLSIYVMDIEETEPVLISHGNYSNQQVISPAGNKLVYSGFYEGAKCVLFADLEDTTESYLKKISKNDDANLEPDMNADASEFVYASFNNQLKGTIIYNKDGREIPLSKGIPSANRPKFSPDASKIAFVGVFDMAVKLYTMNKDGSDRKLLAIKGGNTGTFQWLDNDRILYDAEDGKSYSVGIINVNSGECTVLAGEGYNLHPSYPGR
jgi:Tol biopolymer transport system component